MGGQDFLCNCSGTNYSGLTCEVNFDDLCLFNIDFDIDESLNWLREKYISYFTRHFYKENLTKVIFCK